MSGSLAPFLKQTWTDSNGNPLSGGKLFSYQAGTTTAQATYTDSSLGTPNANPVILNAAGQADVWLDPSLSYKFILQDANEVQQWSVDGVIGLLSANAINTASLQDGSVTTAKISNLAVDNTKLKSDASVDANRAVTTDHIRDSAITAGKIVAGSINRSKIDSTLLPTITAQAFTAGSGTYNKNYTFAIATGSATVGATYTNNGVTYTVYATVAASGSVVMSGSGAPTASGTLTKASGTGDATLTFSYVVAPAYLRVRLVGGGGGGGGGGGSAGSGGAGGNTTFGVSLLTAGGGSGGPAAGAGGATAGGTVSVSAPAIQLAAIVGATGTANVLNGAGITPAGSYGGASPFGGAGGGNAGTSPSAAAATNSGSGGGAGGANSGASSGGAGAAGGYIEALIVSPSATYAYSIGVAGAAGSAGSGGGAGGAGGSGLIIVEEYYQ